MHRVWNTLVRPLLEAAAPRIVVEIGVAAGANTKNLLLFCRRSGAILHAIDPAPSAGVAALEGSDAPVVFHRARSLDVLPSLPSADVVLVDGDHNWYTVFNELRLLEQIAQRAERAFPIVVLHDVGWPYARRDMYYDPDSIPDLYRRPFRRLGLHPDGAADTEGGINDHLRNATVEGGPQNGVLTALEDFLSVSPTPLELVIVDGFHGLAVLAPAARLATNEALRRFVSDLRGTDALRRHLAAVEDGRVRTEVRAAARTHAEQAARTALGARWRRRLAEQNRGAAAERAELQRQATDLRAALAELEPESDRLHGELERSHASERSLRTELVALEREVERLAALTGQMAASSLSRVLFLLPTGGGGGGAHSVVQEALGMRELGIEARVAVENRNREGYLGSYPPAAHGVFMFYETLEDAIALGGRFDCVVATIFHSTRLAQLIAERHPDVAVAYYVQDYEPWFFDESAPHRKVALDSYRLVPGMVLFAKTRWLCELVEREHGVEVRKVAPSLDRAVYHANARVETGSTVRISAMLRPSTAYRAAPRTLRVLRRLARALGDRVELHAFGSSDEELAKHGLVADFPIVNEGPLVREQVAELLRRTDIFVDLSDWQAFGRTGLEAMACGAAVVVPARGGTSEYARHGENAFVVDTRDEQECCAAVRRLVEDGELRTRLRDGGLAAARSYSIQSAALTEVAVLASAVKRHRHSRALAELERLERERGERDRQLEELRGAIASLSGELRYSTLVEDVRGIVERVVPAKAHVAVASKGDTRLVDLGRRATAHFPADADGSYAGHYPADADAAVGHLEELRSRGVSHIVFPATAFWWLDYYAGLRSHLERCHRELWRDERCVIYSLAARVRGGRDTGAVASANGQGNLPKHILYEELIAQVGAVVDRVVPRGATVAVVSKGDDRFLRVEGRRAWHFPRQPDGIYLGHHPPDGASALVHLEAVRTAGTQYLVFPSTAFWWLDHYRELRDELDTAHRRVWDDARCIVFDISRRRLPRPGTITARVRASRLRRRLPPPPRLERASAAAVATTPASATAKIGEDTRSFPVEPISGPPQLEPHRHLVDIVVCIHNAIDDVRSCLGSVVRHTTAPYSLILVDDGSDEPTATFVDAFADEHGSKVVRNEQARGYTFAANQGLRASRGDYVVLLNSDTVVTPDWLDRLVACAESDPRIGLVGPLSNAATWQSVPEVVVDGEWARNTLPAGIDEDEFARLVACYSARVYPRLPFLNGFCLLLRRSVLEDVGLFDEDAFGRGYGEENDYCLRAGRAGWELAVADDAYVVHRVGRSYTEERRRPLSRAAHETLLARHGKEFVEERTDVCRHDRVLEGVRARVRAIAAREAVRTAAREAWAGKRVAFVLPVHRPGGGANIVMHEAEAMWRMGVAVSLVNLERNRPGFTKSYADNRVPAVYARDETAIADALAGYDAVFATWCESVNWLDRLPDNGTRTVRAYYIQDFEPYFFQPGSEGYQVAWNSYTRYPDLVRVAKTEWDRDEVARRIGVDSVVGGPTLDIDLHRPRRREGDWPARPLRILAMVRPSTPRRAPRLTMDVLREVERSRGDAVEIVIFGCESHDPQFLDLPRDFRWRNAGVLNRLEVAALVNEVDVFVDFSEFQAQGLTAMEGMACGVAVVAPRRGGATSFVRDGLNGLVVDTSSYDACLHAVLRLVDDDRLRLAIQRQAIHDICDFFPERGAFRTLEAVLGDGVSAAQAVLTEAGAT